MYLLDYVKFIFSNYIVLNANGLEYFRDLSTKFGYIKDFQSAFEVFFMLQTHQQVILVIMGIGVFIVTMIFIIGFFVDKHN